MSGLLTMGPDGILRNGEAWNPEEPFYAVLGDPIEHSLSPRMHEAALAERELPHEYLPFRLTPQQVPALKEWSRGGPLAGFNVTAPLKETVAAICEQTTEQAAAIGAVNTVKVTDGLWHGHNTDSGGILSVLAEAWSGEQPPPVTVLGTGGSARAAVDALARWGADRIRVQAHSAAGSERFAAWLAGRGDLPDAVVESLPDAPPPVPDGPLIWIDCLAGGVSARPYLPDAAGESPAFLLDLRYGSQLPLDEAPLGFGFADGRPVLLMQGVLSFAWWFGPPLPMQRMRAALA